MTDLSLAVQDGLYEKLSANVTLAPVYQHTPDGTEPPVVIIGQDVFTAEGDKSGRLERHTCEIITLVRGSSRKALYALQAEVYAALHGEPITFAGATLSAPAFLDADDELLEDGKTYYGRQRFEVWAQPA